MGDETLRAASLLIAGGMIVGLATLIFWASRPEGRVSGSVDALVAKLAADESWQDHLEEPERKMLLHWAREEMEETLAQRFTHVIGQMRMANATSLKMDELVHFSSGGFTRLEILKAIVGIRD